jgi:hypothetical protein
MTKQRLEKEFTDEEIDSMVQEFRRCAKEEHPDENEELFPNNAEELRDYILTLEENYKHKPTEHLREELRVYKAHQTGIYKGFCFAFEQLMSEADKVKREHPADEEDRIANNLSTKKVFNFLENEKKVNPERMISKKELLKETRLTREDLEKAGIQNTGRYLVDEPKRKKRKKGGVEDEE